MDDYSAGWRPCNCSPGRLDEECERYLPWVPPFLALLLTRSSSSSSSDPIFISLISGILETIARFPSPGVYEALIKAALPSLCQALGSSGPDSSWIASSSLDLLTGIIRGVDNGKGLGEGFFAVIASPLFKRLREAEDRDVLQVRGGQLSIVLQISSFLLEWGFLLDGHHSERRPTGPGLDRPDHEPVRVDQHSQLRCSALTKSRRVWRVIHWRSYCPPYAQSGRGGLASPSRASTSNVVTYEDRQDRNVYPGT